MRTIRFTVYCFNRYLVIDVPNQDEDRAQAILKKRYDEWHDDKFADEVADWCCEEYMLAGLNENGIVYIERKPALTAERIRVVEEILKSKHGDERCYHILGAALTEPDVFFNVCMAETDAEAVDEIETWWAA